LLFWFNLKLWYSRSRLILSLIMLSIGYVIRLTKSQILLNRVIYVWLESVIIIIWLIGQFESITKRSD
jgi:hypothetical protein